MSVIDSQAILEGIREDRERMRRLGISEEREHDYYGELSVDSSDPAQDETAFQTAINGLNLSETDQRFVRKVLDSGDGR